MTWLSAAITRSAGASDTDAPSCPVSTGSRPCDIEAPFPPSGNVHAFGELDQLRGERRARRIVLPRRIARDSPPLVDGGLVEVGDLGALLGIDLGDLLVVGHRLLAAEGFHLEADRHDGVLLIFLE